MVDLHTIDLIVRFLFENILNADDIYNHIIGTTYSILELKVNSCVAPTSDF